MSARIILDIIGNPGGTGKVVLYSLIRCLNYDCLDVMGKRGVLSLREGGGGERRRELGLRGK